MGQAKEKESEALFHISGRLKRAWISPKGSVVKVMIEADGPRGPETHDVTFFDVSAVPQNLPPGTSVRVAGVLTREKLYKTTRATPDGPVDAWAPMLKGTHFDLAPGNDNAGAFRPEAKPLKPPHPASAPEAPDDDLPF